MKTILAKLKQATRFVVVPCLVLANYWSPAQDVEVDLFGRPFTVPDGGLEDFAFTHWQIVDQNQYKIELIPKKAHVVDAGANMGIFSIFAAVKNPDATVYAFEPAPKAFAALKKNTAHYPNIKVFNCALGDTEKDASLFILPRKTLGSHIVEKASPDRSASWPRKIYRSIKNYVCAVPIKVTTIDRLQLRVDFLKMDAEGSEASIIKGATDAIKKYKPVISMSAYHRPNDEKELPALLNSLTPYHCELQHEGDEDLICTPIAEPGIRSRNNP